MEESQNEFSSLPLKELLSHKQWKARVFGYSELAKLLTSNSTGSLKEYSDPVRSIPLDSNAAALDTGLGAVLIWIKKSNSDVFCRSIHRDLVIQLVEKGLTSSRTSTKNQATQAIVEIAAKNGISFTIEILTELVSHKNAKVVGCSISMLTVLVIEFGINLPQCKQFLDILHKLFGEADKFIRAESFNFTKELYKWLGPSILPFLSTLKPVQLKELNEEFSKLDKSPAPVPIRNTSCKGLAPTDDLVSGISADAPQHPSAETSATLSQIDIWDSSPSIEISSIFSTSIENLLSSGWKEKKEILDTLGDSLNPSPRLKLASNPLLEELITALTRLISSDLSIAVVLSASRCIDRIALAARCNFPAGKYPMLVLQALISRTREKKSTVVDVLVNASDSILSKCIPPLSFSMILESIGIGTGSSLLGSKVPIVRVESLKLLLRSLKEYNFVPSKNELSTLLSFSDPSLVSLTSDSVGDVRDVACEVFGALLLRGKQNIHILQKSLDLIGDKLKLSKIQAASKENNMAANTQLCANDIPLSTVNRLSNSLPVTSISTNSSNKTPHSITKKQLKTPYKTPLHVDAISKLTSQDDLLNLPEPHLAELSARELIDSISPKLLSISSSWKDRVSYTEESMNLLNPALKNNSISLEAITCVLVPMILTESVIAVSIGYLNLIDSLVMTITSNLTNVSEFSIDSQKSLSLLLRILNKCLGDVKLSVLYTKILTALVQIAATTNFRIFECLICLIGGSLKKASTFPKVTISAFSLCSSFVPQLCAENMPLCNSTVQVLKDWIGVNLASAQPSLRTASQTFASLLLGHYNLLSKGFISLGLSKIPDVKNSIRCNQPCSKNLHLLVASNNNLKTGQENQPTSTITKLNSIDTVSKANSNISLPTNVISIDQSTILSLSSSNWNERKAALDILHSQFSSCVSISLSGPTSFFDLVDNLRKRFEDSNRNIAIQALEFFSLLISRIVISFCACSRLWPNLLPSIMACLSDSKPGVRSAAHSSLLALTKFSGESSISALISEVLGRIDSHPASKKEILTWLDSLLSEDSDMFKEVAQSLLQISCSKYFLNSLLPSSLQDRLPECRKVAISIMGRLVNALGLETMRLAILQISPKGSPLLSSLSLFTNASTSNINSASLPSASSFGMKSSVSTILTDSLAKSERSEFHASTNMQLPMTLNKIQPDSSDECPLRDLSHSSYQLPSKIPTPTSSTNPTTPMTVSSVSIPPLPTPPFLADLSNSVLVQRLAAITESSNSTPTSLYLLVGSLRSKKTKDTFQIEIIDLIAKFVSPHYCQASAHQKTGFISSGNSHSLLHLKAADSLLEIGIFCPAWVRSLLLSEGQTLLSLDAIRIVSNSNSQLAMALLAVVSEILIRAIIISIVKGTISDAISNGGGSLSSMSNGVGSCAPLEYTPLPTSNALILFALDAIEAICSALEFFSGRLGSLEGIHLALFLITLSTLDPRDAIRQRARRFLIDGFLRIYPASKLLNPLLIDLVEAACADASLNKVYEKPLISSGSIQHRTDENTNQPTNPQELSPVQALALPLAASVRSRSELVEITGIVILRVGSILLSGDKENHTTVFDLSQRIIDVGSVTLAMVESDPLVRRSLIGMLSSLASAMPFSQLVDLVTKKMDMVEREHGRSTIGGLSERTSIIERLNANAKRIIPNSPIHITSTTGLNLTSPIGLSKRSIDRVGGTPLSADRRHKKKDVINNEHSFATEQDRIDNVREVDEALPSSLADLSMDNICLDVEVLRDSIVPLKLKEEIEPSMAFSDISLNSTFSLQSVFSSQSSCEDIDLILQRISSHDNLTAIEAISLLALKIPSGDVGIIQENRLLDEVVLLLPYSQSICLVLCKRAVIALSSNSAIETINSYEASRLVEEIFGCLLAFVLNAQLLASVGRSGVESLLNLLLTPGLLQMDSESPSTLPLISNLVLKGVISNSNPGYVIGIFIELCAGDGLSDTHLQCLWRASKNLQSFFTMNGDNSKLTFSPNEVSSEILLSCRNFIEKHPVSKWNSFTGIRETTVRSIKTILNQIAQWIFVSSLPVGSILPPKNVCSTDADESLNALMSVLLSNQKPLIQPVTEVKKGDPNAVSDSVLDTYRSRLLGYTDEFYKLSNEARNTMIPPSQSSPMKELKKQADPKTSSLSCQIMSIKERLAKIKDSI